MPRIFKKDKTLKILDPIIFFFSFGNDIKARTSELDRSLRHEKTKQFSNLCITKSLQVCRGNFKEGKKTKQNFELNHLKTGIKNVSKIVKFI